jgi:zinc transport system substrate-binding protein
MRFWSIGLVVLVGLAGGCDRSGSTSSSAPSPDSGGGTKATVLASVYPMAEMAQRVGGAWVDAQWLVEGGRRPEQIDAADVELRQRANKAAAVIIGGPWDTWALADLSPDARSIRVIEPARMPAAEAANADERAYLWLDPAVVREMVDRLRVRLTVLDARHDQGLRANATAYLAEVDAVDREFTAALAPLKGRKVLVVRPVWGGLLSRYGLEQVAPAPVAEEKLTAADFKDRIVPAAKAAGVRAIFVDEATPAGVRQQIEDRTGLRVLSLDSVGTSAADGRNTWARVMRYDLEQLRKGLEP